jgi:catechol 2,3-dioxygenase-like lactoylglutathione lyase family enzyme
VAYNPRIIGIALITTDLERACAFYEQALGFDPMGFVRYGGAEVATLRLGEETLHLVRPDRLGRTYPQPQAANDPWFQHFAIAVSDAAAAFERLSRLPFTPISRGGPILLPPSSGSVIAYKFRDPTAIRSNCRSSLMTAGHGDRQRPAHSWGSITQRSPCPISTSASRSTPARSTSSSLHAA